MTTTSALSRTASLPVLAKSVAVRRLTATLLERGMHDHAAEAISLAVCDPATARRQLSAPGRLRVDGGYLEVIHTEVWVPAVMQLPTNPRALPAFAYETEEATGRRNPLPALSGTDDPQAVELLVPGVRSAQLVGALDAQVEYLRRANDLRESVGELGIREPLLLVPLVIDLEWGDSQHVTSDNINDVDGRSTPAILGAIDGSSRVSAAHFHLGIDPAQTLFKYLGDTQAVRLDVAHTLKLATHPGDLSVEEAARCLSLVAPAAVVVGFVPDGPHDTLLTAINSRLGALHVDPPKAWSASSRLDVQLDAALESLVIGERLDPVESAWLAGRMTHTEAEDLGFRDRPDVRAAHLLKTIGKSDSISARALRSLTTRSRITPKLRAEIAAEGALRSFRSEVSDVQANAARSLLTAIYLMDDVQRFAWEVQPYRHGPSRSADKARADAWEELELLGVPGKTAVTILVLSAYWLARMRVVPRQTRGGQDDRRDITTVLGLMIRDKRGIRQLIQVIQDGRNGVPPRQVAATGKMSATSTPVSDEWIRKTWSSTSDPHGPVAPPSSPEAQLRRAIADVQGAITELKLRVEGLKEPRLTADQPLIDSVGLESNAGTAMIADLLNVQMRLSVLQHIGLAHSAQASPSLHGEGGADGGGV